MKYSPWRRALNLPHGALPGALHTQIKQIYTNTYNYKQMRTFTNNTYKHIKAASLHKEYISFA